VTARKVFVWQWGKRGAGPRIAVDLANGLAALPRTSVQLSLSDQAEILHSHHAPANVLTFRTYRSAFGLFCKFLQAPVIITRLFMAILSNRPDIAICAMPGPLDVLMAHALRRAGVPVITIIHDARAHPGDGYPLMQIPLPVISTRIPGKGDLVGSQIGFNPLDDRQVRMTAGRIERDQRRKNRLNPGRNGAWIGHGL